MSDLHVSRELLDAVFEGKRTVFDLAPVLFCHLFDLCPQCKLEYDAFAAELEESGEGFVLPLIPPEFDVPDEDDLDPELRLRIEDARGRLRELLALPSDEQLEAVTRTPRRFRGPLLAGLLLEECRERLPGRPKEAHTLAQLAKAVLEHGDPHPLVSQLYARAVAYGASALRAQGQVRQAAEVFGHARFLLKADGGGDRYTRAELDWLEGALRRDQRRLAEAKKLLIRAVLAYRMEGEQTAGARALLSLGMVYREQGELDAAIAAAHEALGLAELPAERDSDFRLFAQHNLACWLADAERFEEARSIMISNAESYEHLSDAVIHLRRTWLEARISRGMGDAGAAEETFNSVRVGFLQEGNAYDAALVSLELAILYAEGGRTAEVRALVEEIVPAFEEQEVHREALAALILLRDASRADAVTVAFLNELATYFERARRDPGLPFQKPS